MDEANALLSTPLLQWIFQLGNNATTACNSIRDLADGVYLNEVVCNISRPHFQPYIDRIRDEVRNDQDRQANLSVLLESITNFYQDELSCIVVMELPIVDAIVRDPFSEEGVEGLRKFCLLMLGCAVKCQNRERYVSQLKELPEQVQAGLIDNIKEIFNGLLDAPFDTLEDLPQEGLVELCRELLERLNTAVADRDQYAQRLNEATWLVFESSRREASQLAEMTEEDANQVKQLRQQLNVMMEELDTKTMAYEELLEDHDARRNEINLLTVKVRELQTQADDVQSMRDDLDIWKDKAKDADKFRSEVARLQQKVEDYDYTSKRFQEVKEQNELLQQQVESQKDAAKAADALHDELATQERLAQTFKLQLEEMQDTQESLLIKERQLHTTVARKEEQLQESRAELAALRKKLTEAQSMQASDLVDGETVPLKEHLRLETEVQQLQLKLASMQAYADEARVARDDAKATKAALKLNESQLEDLRADQRERVQKQADMQRTIEELESELIQLRGKADDTARNFKQAYSDEKRRMEALEDRLDVALSKSLQLKEERIQVLEARLTDANAQIDSLRADVDMYQRHNDLLRQSARDSPLVIVNSPSATPGRRESKPLNAAMSSPLVQHKTSGPSMVETSVASSADHEALAQLKRDNKKLKRELAQAIDSTSQPSQEIDGLRGQVARLKKEQERLHDKLDRYREKVKQHEAYKTKFKKRVEHYAEKASKNERLRLRLEEENLELAEQMNKVLMKNRQLTMHSEELEQALMAATQPPVLEEVPEETDEDVSIVPPAAEAAGKGKRKWFGKRKSKNKDLNVTATEEQPAAAAPTQQQSASAIPQKLTQRVYEANSPASTPEPGTNPFSPGSEVLGLYEILREGREKTAAKGFVKTPSHPPAVSRIEQKPREAKKGLTGSPMGTESALEFLLNSLQDKPWGNAPPRQPLQAANSNRDNKLSRRKSSLLSGASRRGRPVRVREQWNSIQLRHAAVGKNMIVLLCLKCACVQEPSALKRVQQLATPYDSANASTMSELRTPSPMSTPSEHMRPTTAPATPASIATVPVDSPETVRRASSLAAIQPASQRRVLQLSGAPDPSWDDAGTV
eukprot:TRINITY_DN11649_c0_g1_i1.p1 TRINITY_DN11649_c0_g1~~TRINITY_DN11649_c0_g1_i1.p1  ORF type:complete len:1096 (+),score=327.11 TRINITY_DN11649_c0_g1_i1:74-3361(+)